MRGLLKPIGFAVWTILVAGVALWLGRFDRGIVSLAEAGSNKSTATSQSTIGRERLKQTPIIEHYKTTKFNLADPAHRMKRSVWNYFFLDQENKLVAGYWEAEGGFEDLGRDPFHELLYVISGKLYVEYENREQVAEPGDTVNVLKGRPCRVRAKESVKVFFVCAPLENPLGYERMVLDEMEKKK